MDLKRINFLSAQFWGLLVSLLALFLMGGSSRDDVQSLIFLNPVMITCCGAALLTLRRQHLNEKKWFLICFVFVFLTTSIYSTLLSTKSPFDGFGILASSPTIAGALGSSNGPFIRSISSWQPIFFLFAPFSVFLFAIQLSLDELKLTLPLAVAVGTISGVIGVLQLAGGTNGPLYFYDVSNRGSAVGFFANRNHAAVFLACLFPMLAVLTANVRMTKAARNNILQLTAVTILVIMIPLILVTGSRSGLLTAVLAVIGSVLLYGSPATLFKKSISRKSTAFMVATIFLSLIMMTVYFSRAESLERFFIDPELVNGRTEFWLAGLPLFWKFFPLGFGPGNFVPVFQVVEPIDMLSSVYLNRLHNDWLETALAFGVPGCIFILAGMVYFLRRSFILWLRMDGRRSSVAMSRMASIVIAILAMASISDYPLRTPAMAGFAALALVWFAHARRDPIPR